MRCDKSNRMWDEIVKIVKQPEVAVGLGAGLWAIVTFVVNERRANSEWIAALFTQLERQGDLSFENPAVRAYLCEAWGKEPAYFKEGGGVPRDDNFYRAKSLVYNKLNIFDSIVAKTTQTGEPLGGCRLALQWALMPGRAELRDWDQYILRTMQHPLYRAIVEEESEIFGKSLRVYYETKVKSAKGTPSMYMW
jgi:hypothetical protein